MHYLMNQCRHALAAATLGFALCAGAAGVAQAASALPGGASSLTETYGNWTVNCVQRPQGENKNVVCSMSQQQVDEKGQRALAAELSASKDGTSGVFVLPFGLKLSEGVTLQLDENKADQPIGFTTCVPAGCVVPVALDAAKADAYGKGKSLALLAKSVDGNDIKLAVPLEGFGPALKRVRELLK